MMRRKNDLDDLGRLLRRGDPAADGRDPDAREVARWRAAMLATAEARRRPGLRPLWLAPLAGAALAAVLLTTLPWRTPPPTPTPARTVPEPGAPPTVTAPAAEPGAMPADTSPAAAAVPASTAPERMAARGEPPAPAPGPPGAGVPDPAGTAQAAATPAVARRSVQFTAPGGTRIIWTLDSRFELSAQGGAS